MSKILPGTLLLALIGAGGCMMPPPGSGGGASPAYASSSAPGSSAPMSEAVPAAAPPAAPQVVSVTLHNDCNHTVKLFLGEKPGFSSGTQTSLSSNTTTSYQMKPGDILWITDDSENGVSSTSIGGGSSQRINITASCSGFGPG